MEKSKKQDEEYYTVDLLHIIKSLWKRVWLIIIAGFLGAVIGFSIAHFFIAPTYSSSVVLYVNNINNSSGSTSGSISTSQIDAAQKLVKTYGIILKNRSTLEEIIEETEVAYDCDELSDMINVAAINETEVMRVTVTSTDADEAAKIANGIATVLPHRISDIISGATMTIVDNAIPNYEKVAPSRMKYTLIGGVIGGLVSVIALVIVTLADDRIHDEEYLLRKYDYPVLAKIPDLLVEEGGKKYKKYYYSHAYGTPQEMQELENENVELGEGR